MEDTLGRRDFWTCALACRQRSAREGGNLRFDPLGRTAMLLPLAGERLRFFCVGPLTKSRWRSAVGRTRKERKGKASRSRRNIDAFPRWSCQRYGLQAVRTAVLKLTRRSHHVSSSFVSFLDPGDDFGEVFAEFFFFLFLDAVRLA